MVEIDAIHVGPAGSRRRTTLPGIPTTVHPSGTFCTTTELAPTRALAPMLIGPRIFAPAPTSTPSPRVGWRLPLAPAGSAQGHTVIEGDVVADLGGFADHHPSAMVNEEARTDAGAGVDIDVAQQPSGETQQTRGIAPLASPQAMREAVEHDCVHARIGGQHLQRGRAAGRAGTRNGRRRGILGTGSCGTSGQGQALFAQLLVETLQVGALRTALGLRGKRRMQPSSARLCHCCSSIPSSR